MNIISLVGDLQRISMHAPMHSVLPQVKPSVITRTFAPSPRRCQANHLPILPKVAKVPGQVSHGYSLANPLHDSTHSPKRESGLGIVLKA
jgi:hypothetical protein